ncbi:HupE/UreJ family protein [Actinocorallia sp. B10E7]|uniref:HupE/UreJ family protein n=1 Tax=Actinocorallia sp. B10E7 TaxID=3153558 RepID=UPI00325D771F
MSVRGGLLVVGRMGGAALLAAVLVAVVPAAAYAHGVSGTGESVRSFFWSGLFHMLGGWDHLLFVAGVVLLAGTVRRSAQMISLFALGHSTTLIVATLAEWRLDPLLVDVVIVLSLVFVGVVGLIGRPRDWRWFAACVVGFGLVHGLGLSTRLQEAGLPEGVWDRLARTIVFNIGVEVGQLLALGLMVWVGSAWSRRVPWAHTRKAAHGVLAAIGLVTAVLLSFGVLDATEEEEELTAFGGCQVRIRTETYPGAGERPAKDFYEPSQTVPMEGFGRMLSEHLVVVHYRPDLPADQLAALRAFVTGDERVVAGPAPGQREAFKAVNLFQTLLCDDFDLETARRFTDDWLPEAPEEGQ